MSIIEVITVVAVVYLVVVIGSSVVPKSSLDVVNNKSEPSVVGNSETVVGKLVVGNSVVGKLVVGRFSVEVDSGML